MAAERQQPYFEIAAWVLELFGGGGAVGPLSRDAEISPVKPIRVEVQPCIEDILVRSSLSHTNNVHG